MMFKFGEYDGKNKNVIFNFLAVSSTSLQTIDEIKNIIVISALLHTSRNPDIWKNR